MGRILWLASYPKSGNTWVRAFLHSLIVAGGASHDINRMARLAVNEAALANFTALAACPSPPLDAATVARLRPLAQQHLAGRDDGTVFAKTHLAATTWRGHPTIDWTATAGAICIVRDPRDIALSYADHQGLGLDRAIDLLNLDDHETPASPGFVAEPMGNWSQHVESWTASADPTRHVMRYEDMLAEPTTAFGALAGFLGIPAPAGQLAAAIASSSFAALRHQEESHGFVERSAAQARFFRQGRAGAWRDALSRDQVARIVDKHFATMTRLGYLPPDR